MNKVVLFYYMLTLVCLQSLDVFSQQVYIEGNFKKWHKITLNFEGEILNEYDIDNPFLDYRLNVMFKHEGRVITVPGFFAADGKAKDTGARSGKVWQVRFMPDAVGEWTYEAFFRKGKDIAVNDSLYAGEATSFNGVKGHFTVVEGDATGSDFRTKGRLQYDGTRYLKYADHHTAFLKGGADSPENFLAYYEFDQTPASHKYQGHAKDWHVGDPTWGSNSKGKNIIGALNYLASKGMNSVYFLTMNVQGDGKDVWPWTSMHERYRFDCSKLDQWELVFDHMDALGLMLHIVTQETENELLLDIGELQTQRKLYYRELIARFAHHLGITWNLGEENGWQSWSPKAQNDADRRAMAQYIKTHDPYDNYIALHTHAATHAQNHVLNPLLGFQYLDGVAMQTKAPKDVHRITKKWIHTSEEFGKPWVVTQDEIGPAHAGAKPDADDPNHDEIRSQVLWGNLMAGGAGVEWYFGYKFAHNDLKCEDWRSRDILWDQTRHALTFFQEHLPFQEMSAQDQLTENSKDYVLAKPGKVYAIYLPTLEKTKLNLTGYKGIYKVQWYNPRTGGRLQNGTSKTIKGGKVSAIGRPPNTTKDWVALITVVEADTFVTKPEAASLVLNALTDFTPQNGKTVYYKDKRNKALAIKASIPEQRQGFASASTVFKGATGMYAVVLQSMAEQDGESNYAIRLNKTLVKEVKNPEVTASFKKLKLNLGMLYLQTNDTITISSNAATNGKIPENDGTAWSRGRWNALVLMPNTILKTPALQTAEAIQALENNHLEIEAEDFHINTANKSLRKWYVRKAKGHAPFLNSELHASTASGNAYIEALPDTRVKHKDPLIRGENFFPIAGSGGIVGYKVNIKEPGRYYVWVKAFSSGPEDNGLHVGIDGHWPKSGQRIQLCKGKRKWTWSSAQRVPENHCGVPKTIYLDVKTAGEHVVLFSMREDGFELDKFIMSPNEAFVPQ